MNYIIINDGELYHHGVNGDLTGSHKYQAEIALDAERNRQKGAENSKWD